MEGQSSPPLAGCIPDRGTFPCDATWAVDDGASEHVPSRRRC